MKNYSYTDLLNAYEAWSKGEIENRVHLWNEYIKIRDGAECHPPERVIRYDDHDDES